jgi:cytochrome b6-f complex iron-sulfur subunit
MSATTLFVLGVVGVSVIAAVGVFAVAFRRGSGAAPMDQPVTGSLDKRAIRQDRAAAEARAAASEGGGVATLTAKEVDTAEPGAPVAPPPDPVMQRLEISAADYAVTRRQFFNRAILGIFGLGFLGSLTISFLAFFWPKLKGGFGTPISVGNFADLRRQLLQSDGSIIPVFVAAAQSWIVPFDPDDLTGSSFEGLDVVAGGGAGEQGLMALWQRCVHLGCRVPSCNSSQGFECPCHGSKYNFHGEYVDGPAPRNMDRFAVSVDDAGNLVVDTGEVRETPRAKTKTISYPQGPSCL